MYSLWLWPSANYYLETKSHHPECGWFLQISTLQNQKPNGRQQMKLIKEKMPYARWATMRLNQITDEEVRKNSRSSYFSNSGKVARYDSYKNYCKVYRYAYDAPPEGYWDYKAKDWHIPVGGLMSLFAIFVALLAGTAGGSMRPRVRQERKK